MPAIGVLVVDDQSLVREGLARIVDASAGMRTLGTAADGREAVAQARALRPDVVLMDVRMPVLDGIESTRRIVADPGCARTRVIGLTTYDDDTSAVSILRAGAVGFLLKDGTAEQLAAAVRAAHSGTVTAAASTARRLLDRLAAQEPTSAADGSELLVLTDREREVFTQVVAGASNLEIAGLLGVAEVTVKTHVSHMLSKLGARDRVQLTIWAHRRGLADRGPVVRGPLLREQEGRYRP